ncbi:MAG: hypothetical protein UZ20_WS6002000636 [candidate division WS6 bacterium OLB21]|uniref:Uncharacterized protein n=1 Tax=candidate division WS6 bacterium OLB21 TaxID=1617427 RepID=A0A136KIQ1_9BACT|nr:MAG: hypothetical protein UZ20_WS6002000636 [candidate division WS6 bacterium OLB21]
MAEVEINQTKKRLERYQTITSEFQNNIVLSLIVSSFLGFIISIGVGLYISNRISNPLKVLQQKLVDMRQNRYKKTGHRNRYGRDN